MLFTNWHRYFIGFLAAIEATCLAIQGGVIPLPTEYHNALFFIEVAGVFLAAVIPNWRDESGPLVPHG